MRLFIAVDPGERFRRDLSSRLDAWRARVSIAWVRPENMHLTLAFLGELPETAPPALQEALRAATAGSGPLVLRPGEVGAFPSLRSPRVLVLHCDSGGRLERLAAAVRAATDPLLPPGQRDDKPFRSHLTLARIKRPLSPAEQRELAGMRLGEWEPLPIAEVRLVRSVLGPAGPTYTDLCAVPLTGPA